MANEITAAALAGIRDRETLFAFLRDELSWPLDPEDTFTYPGLELSGDKVGNAQVSQIVPFGAGDPFLIMLAEFEGKFTRSALREILRGIRQQMRTRARYEGKTPDDTIFICASQGYSEIRFARFEQREGKQPKLSSFGWETDWVDETRTLREFSLPALRMHVNVLDEPDWQMMRPDWLAAWSVERVTDEFFKTYRSVFERVEGMIEGVSNDKRLFTQRLFNRLLFIQFLQKKRWLRFQGSTNYLPGLFAAAKANNEDFYPTRLHRLFFEGLGRAADIPAHESRQDAIEQRIGQVPFLNGGLFEMENGDDVRDAVKIPNAAFDLIFRELFDRYNFTITESTPLDVEVAVDPEMLGRIFEELVTGRHESGSYYTPKPIVSFMCREALKGYLASVVDESPEAIAAFVDQHDAGQLRDGEPVLTALVNVRACDPACGSGAYILGLLHELIDLRSCLFATRKIDADTLYNKKLEIIQKSLYGVDIDQFAVNTARLRLWLSLVVDDTRNPLDDPQLDVSLPNLDFKIEQGDSLTAPDPTGGVQPDMFRRQQIEEFCALKSSFMIAHGEDKWALKKQVQKQRKAIAKGAHAGAEVVGFDWEVDFAEVFLPEEGGAGAKLGGFDIVLANPPYVRQELIKDQKPVLKRVYGDLFSGTADLYVFFYLRALQLLRPGGMLAFISSNKWFRAKYGEKLREHIAETCAVSSITDFGDLPVFESAVAYPMVFIARKGQAGELSTEFTQVESLGEPYPDVRALVDEVSQDLPRSAFAGANWTLADAATSDMLRKMGRAGAPLGEYVKGRIYRGLLTGLNEAFYIDDAKRCELTAIDPGSSELIRPLILGRDCKRWMPIRGRQWQIFTPIGVDIHRYPAIFSHLKQWEPHLERRWDKGQHWWELRACDFYDAFEEVKIIYPQIMVEPNFALDEDAALTNQKCFIIGSGDRFLLGLLNSSTIWKLVVANSPKLRGGYSEPRKDFILSIPIPAASDSDRAAISALAQKCLDAKGVDCEAWEKEIDERVAALYGL